MLVTVRTRAANRDRRTPRSVRMRRRLVHPGLALPSPDGSSLYTVDPSAKTDAAAGRREWGRPVR
ncbi:hypothetical protein GCM10022379_29990 [Micromonospora maritima]